MPDETHKRRECASVGRLVGMLLVSLDQIEETSAEKFWGRNTNEVVEQIKDRVDWLARLECGPPQQLQQWQGLATKIEDLHETPAASRVLIREAANRLWNAMD